MQVRKLLKTVLEEIKPKEAEVSAALNDVKAFVNDLNISLRKARVPAKAVLGGSYAKSTWLAGDFDVDVFVLFSLKWRNKNLSDALAKALSPWKPARIHGSRDYFWVRNNVKYEIVPVLDIKKPSDADNVTDFSHLHVAWVNKKGKQLKDDIMLAKKFCKAASCYGAESYRRGFSGHVIDILTIHYKGFLQFIRAASKWKPQTVIDVTKAHKGKVLFMLNKSKTEGPLVVVDPVQPARNAAAALSEENYKKFIKAAKLFLQNPTRSLFKEKPFDVEKIRKRGALIVNVKTLKAKEDVAGTKMVRAFEFVCKSLDDFGVKDSGWHWDRKAKAVWWFLLRKNKLPKKMEWPGPPIDLEKDAKRFKKKYPRAIKRGKRLVAMVNRTITTPEDTIRKSARNSYVKQRIKSLRFK